MATKLTKQPKKSGPCSLNKYIVGLVVVALIVIAISSVTHTTLALKENSQGNADVIRTKCINGLNKVAWETGVCTLDDIAKLEGVLNILNTEGRAAALDACKAQIASPGCKGICIAAMNCADWQ